MTTRRRHPKADVDARTPKAPKPAPARKSAAKPPRRAEGSIESASGGTAFVEPVAPQSVPHILFTASIAVRWRDLDAFNHVNNSSFLTFLEEARLQWLKGISGPWFDAHSMPVLAAAELNYRAPITWPASITVELTCERLGNSSITLGHRIMAGDDSRQLYCDGRTVLVWADPATGKSVDLPTAIRKRVFRSSKRAWDQHGVVRTQAPADGSDAPAIM